MKLVDDWKKCYTWLSMRLTAVGVVATSMWVFLPALQQALPQPLMIKIIIGLFVAIGIGRLVNQDKKNDNGTH